MTVDKLYAQIALLPDSLKDEVSDFVAFLTEKQKKESQPKKRKLGAAKGLIIMAPDFDEPLEDFKDYM